MQRTALQDEMSVNKKIPQTSRNGLRIASSEVSYPLYGQ